MEPSARAGTVTGEPGPPRQPGEDAEALRAAVLGAAVLVLAATAAGSALGRRWFGLGEVLGWVGLGIAALAVVAVLGARGPGGLVSARVLAAVAAVLGGPAVAVACLVVFVATVRHPASEVVPAGGSSGPPTLPLPVVPVVPVLPVVPVGSADPHDAPTEQLPDVVDGVRG